MTLDKDGNPIDDDPNKLKVVIDTPPVATPPVPVVPTPVVPVVAPVVPPVINTPDPNVPPVVVPPVEPLAKILIDEVEYSLNATGDALNADGTINMTATQLDALENTPEPTDLKIEDIAARINYSPIDENGTPMTYDSNPDGIANFVKDVIDQRLPEMAQEMLVAEFVANPELARAYDYIARYGSLAGIESNVDYSVVDIANADEATKYNMIVAREMEKGETLTHAKMIADLLKDAKKLDDGATVAKTYFDSKNAETKEQARLQAIEDARTANEYWTGVKTAIANRKFTIGKQQIIIPEVIKVNTADGKFENRTSDDFYKYLSEVKTFDLNGQKRQLTQNQYDQLIETSNRTDVDAIYDGLKRFSKYNNEQFIVEIKKANAVAGIRSISTKGKGDTGKPTITKLT